MIEFDRSLCAFICGYLLTSSGSLVQFTTANPLASPSTLGIHALCLLHYMISFFMLKALSLDISLEILTTLSSFMYIVPLLIYKKEKKYYSNSFDLGTQKVILLGLCFNLLVGALFSVLQFLMMAFRLDFPSSIWFGSFKWVPQYIIIPLVLFFITSLFFFSYFKRTINFLQLGPEYFRIHFPKTSFFRFIAIYLLFSSFITIPYFGIFSFVGLLIPQIIRGLNLFDTYYKELIFGSFLGGGSFLVLDLICYHFLIGHAELPLGMITAVLGSLLFMTISIKDHKV